jgi:eukaryotic-like serine/threonine-protein kinase
MWDEDLLQVRAVFDEVFTLDSVERQRYLAAHYAHDVALYNRINQLLAHEAAAINFLEAPVLTGLRECWHHAEGDTFIGSQMGAYRIERELGRGGMGVVYLAGRDDDTFRKQVAIKLVWPGLSQMTDRFRQERQMLADLEHPHIARLLDGGATPEGWQYLVMEYVEGVALTEYCQQHNLSLRARLDLFLDICAAVQHAHQHLIIHRDLKPSNILVTAEGQVKLLDFGIAKALDASAYASDLSLPGTHLMTPEYASPEQLTGASITTASDIYSLGVVLFELLAGQRPFQFASRQPYEVARVLSEHPPPLMSQVRKLEVKSRKSEETETGLLPTPNSRLPTALLRGDLDNIVARALQPEPDRRYASIAQFSEDIRRHLSGEVVQARKPTLAYRAHRFARRHKVVFSAAAAALVVLLAWLAFLLRQVQIERAQAREQRQQLYAAEIQQALEAWKNNDYVQMQKTLEHWQPQTGEEDLRGFEWAYLQRLLNASAHTISFSTEPRTMGLLPQTNYLAVRLASEEVKLFDTSTGQEVRSFPAQGGKSYSNGSGALLRLYEQRKVVLNDLVTGVQIAEFTDAEDGIQTLDYHPAKQRIVTVAANGTIKIRDSVTGAILHRFPGHGQVPTHFNVGIVHLLTVRDEQHVRLDFLQEPRAPLEFSEPAVIRQIALDQSLQYLIVLTAQALTVRDIFTGRIVARQPQGAVAINTFAAALDRRTLVTGSTDGAVAFWTFPALQQLASRSGHTRDAIWLNLSWGMQDLFSASLDRTLIWWDFPTKQKKAVLRGHTGNLITYDFNPATGKIVTASQDRTVRIWDVNEVTKPELLSGHTDHILTVAYSPDGQHIASAGKDNTAILHNANTGAQTVLRGHQNMIFCVRFSPDGKWLATGSEDGTAKLWDVATGRELKTFLNGTRRYVDGVRSLAFLPDGQTLLLGTNDGAILVWDVVTNQIKTRFPAHPREILSLSLAPDAKLLVSGGWEGTFKLWDTTTWQEKAAHKAHQGRVWTAVFSPDGKQLTTSGEDQIIKLWDVATLRLQHTLTGHNDEIFQVAYTPDGRRLASASNDNTVKLWNPQTGQELLTLREHTNEVWGVAFSSDGRTMLTGSWDKTLRLWRAVPR